jgi:hypothetical protein
MRTKWIFVQSGAGKPDDQSSILSNFRDHFVFMVSLDSNKHCLGIILLFKKWHPIFFLCFPGYLVGTQWVSWNIEKNIWWWVLCPWALPETRIGSTFVPVFAPWALLTTDTTHCCCYKEMEPSMINGGSSMITSTNKGIDLPKEQKSSHYWIN